MKSAFNRTLPTWYSRYGSRINEQASTTYSDDADTRLKQYLDNNPTLIDELEAKFNEAGVSAKEEIILDPNTYNVLSGDILTLRVDKTDPDNPRMYLGVENDKLLLGNLNLTTAAGIVYHSMDGIGTYEDEYAEAMSAIHKSCADRGISESGVDRVFSIFNTDAFGTKYEGDNLETWIDEDFDGRAEVCAMQIARIPIPKDIWRGFDLGAMALDIGLILLAIPSFGGSLLAAGALKGTSAGVKVTNTVNKIKKTVKATKAMKKTQALAKTVKGTKAVVETSKVMKKLMKPLISGWNKLSKAAKIRAFGKAYPVGAEVTWRSGGKVVKNVFPATVKEINKATGKVLMTHSGKAGQAGHKAFWVSMDTFMTSATKATGPTIETITKVSKSAALSAPAIAALAAHKMESDLAKDNYSGEATTTGEEEGPSAGDYATGIGQALINYDPTTADPSGAIAKYKTQAAAELATQIYNAHDGWTSNSDELVIAMMILSLDKISAQNLLKEWNNLYAGTSFYSEIIAGELESDMAEIVGAYWGALTGDGPKAAKVDAMLARISK